MIQLDCLSFAGRDLLHCVCSVSTAISEQDAVTSNVAGFVVMYESILWHIFAYYWLC